jgi:hypothetical protein
LTKIRFLIDENVPTSVGNFLADRGHSVIFAKDVFGESAPDPLLAFTAELEGIVVVTHDRDFRRFSKLIPSSARGRFARGAGRISLNVTEDHALGRVREELDVIEFHFERAVKARRRLMLVINETGIQSTTHTRRA